MEMGGEFGGEGVRDVSCQDQQTTYGKAVKLLYSTVKAVQLNKLSYTYSLLCCLCTACRKEMERKREGRWLAGWGDDEASRQSVNNGCVRACVVSFWTNKQT